MATRNMEPRKNPMPAQPPHQRRSNFEEVALGYSPDQAAAEAARCLNCKGKPCVSGCPVRIDIPGFLACAAEKDFAGAYEVIAKASSLPAVCGRVCPQESQCEEKCVRGVKGEAVAIGRVERFVADWQAAHATGEKKPPAAPAPNAPRVAVVGSGPAGLSCAGELAKHGCAVTIYEALHTPGGVLVYGIPEFRLPKAIVRREIDALREAGVEIVTNAIAGRSLTVDELLQDHDAVFIGSGAGLPRFMGIPGEALKGVCSANEFLTRVNLMGAYREGSATPVQRPRRAVVVGGGNVAMDAARSALRLGAQEVSVVYRRSMEELPARAEEVEHAREEGIIFRLLRNPVEIIGDADGWAASVKCARMELGEPDASGRRRPVVIPDAYEEIPADCVIMAIGTSPNPLLTSTTPGLDTQRWGGIVVDEMGRTSRKGVYAGGDAVTGAATVILAMGAGKTAAQAILEDLRR